MVQQKIASGLFGGISTEISNQLLYELCFTFVIVILFGTLISFLLFGTHKRIAIVKYVKNLETELRRGNVATEKGFNQCKEKYDEIYNEHLENTKVYLSKKENSIFQEFLNTYSDKYDTHNFKVSEMAYALSKLKGFLSFIIQVVILFVMSYANILVAPDKMGFTRAIIFLCFGVIILLMKYALKYFLIKKI